MIRSIRTISVTATGVVWLIIVLWPRGGINYEYLLSLSRIQFQEGSAFETNLPSIIVPLISPDDIRHPTRSLAVILEDGHPLGPAHSLHTDIRAKGQGAFSQWGRLLVFSTSDNSDPRINERRYIVKLNLRPSAYFDVVGIIMLLFSVILHPALPGTGMRWLFRQATKHAHTNGALGKLVLGLSAIVITLFFFAIDGEVWIRLRRPEIFSDIKYPAIWKEGVGFIFSPKSELQYTNHLDFWVRQMANSYGFLDREWSVVKPPNTVRVAFIGNSMVEAVQVPIAEKIQVQFEADANSTFAPCKFETAAFAYAGTGQANQLPYYDFAGRLFHPDIVVLEFNYTDFAYNSALLESVRYGWHPDHLPMASLVRKSPSTQYVLAPPSARWQEYTLPTGMHSDSLNATTNTLHDWLMNRSYFYCWLASLAPLKWNELSIFLPKQQFEPNIESKRIIELRGMRGYEHSFDGWKYPHDWDMDSMFGAEHLAPIFQDGVESTGAALDAFIERSKRDHFRIIIFATELVSRDIDNADIEKETGNHGLAHGAYSRLKQLADERQIPIVDFSGYAQRHDIDPASTHWAHDLHWNSLGHQLAARALLDAFRAHPEWLTASTLKN